VKGITAFLLLVVLFRAQAGGKEEAGWPQWRGPNGDGISHETDWNPDALAGGAKVLWKADAGIGFSNVAIQDDFLCTMGMVDLQDHVLCFNASTGEEIWRYSFETSSYYGPMATPAIDGNRVFALGWEGTLLCLNVKNGELVWSKDLRQDFDAHGPSYGFAGSPAVHGKLLILNANDKIVGLDKRSGDLVWSVEDEVPRHSSGTFSTVVVAELGGERCAMFLGSEAFHAVEVQSGRELWFYDHDDAEGPVADPIVLGEKVWLSLNRSCVLTEVSENVPSEVWNSTTALNAGLSNPVLVDGYLFGMHWPLEYRISSHDWNRVLQLGWPFRCVSWETGEVMWEQHMKAASVTAAGNMLILLELDGTLHIVEASPASFYERSRADVLAKKKTQRIFITPPVILEGKIYCRNHHGDLVCIDVSK
jgi:outer membrane protein assembly factor BamB